MTDEIGVGDLVEETDHIDATYRRLRVVVRVERGSAYLRDVDGGAHDRAEWLPSVEFRRNVRLLIRRWDLLISEPVDG